MTSRIILKLNKSFESYEKISSLNARLKQISELGFENIAIHSSFLSKYAPQEINLHGLLIKAIFYPIDFDVDSTKKLIELHHKFDCRLALTPESLSEGIKDEFESMGLLVESNLTVQDISEKSSTIDELRIMISPLKFNLNPLQSKLVDEDSETKKKLEVFLKLTNNPYLLIDYPDLNTVDFLKQAKDTLNRLYFMHVR